MNFIEFLNENQSKYPWMIKSRDKIEQWLRFHPATRILPEKINDDLTIGTIYTLIIGDDDLVQYGEGHYLPVHFTQVGEYTFTTFKQGASLIGSPKKVEKFTIKTGTVNSFEGIPEEAEMMNLSQWNNLTSLKGINNHIKSCERMIIPIGIKSNILGLLYIKDLEIVSPPFGKGEELINALIILHKHLKGDNDVLECQEELISAGYKEYAKL